MTIQQNALEKINGNKKVSVPSTMKGLKSKEVKDIFEAYRDQIAEAVPKHLTPDRVIQIATTLIARTPELAECSSSSRWGAVIQSSILGFELVPVLGLAYLVPFNNKKTGKREVQFIIGYKGLVDLARRSDKIKTIYAQAVYEHDTFSYEYGLEPNLIHKPHLGERGNFTFAYAVATFINGGFAFEVMSKSDIDKVKKSSQAGDSKYSPWNSGYYDEMAKKTVIRRLSKLLPMNVELAANIESDSKVIKTDSFTNNEIDLNLTEEVDYTFEEETEQKTDHFADVSI